MATVDTSDRDPRALARWADRLLDRAYTTGPIPPSASPAWAALDDADPRKPAAVVLTALASLTESTREAISARLAAELDELDRVAADRLKAASAQLSGAADWSLLATGPTARELAARRAAPGPLAAPIDRAAAARWAATGTSSTTDRKDIAA